jgi:hypothetical protein
MPVLLFICDSGVVADVGVTVLAVMNAARALDIEN